jgi:magnesium-transporting ATPase (P-type)
MNDDRYTRQPIARWYTAAAIVSLLFMLVGCAGYLLEVTTDPASLPLDQRAVHDAQPLWLISANAIAVWVGAVGAFLLVLRRKLAEPLMLVSMIAVAIWLAGLLLVPRLRDLLGTDDLAVAVVVTVITWTIYWFARHSRQRGWLR